MRTLQLSLMGTAILALLAGLSGAVIALDEPADPMEPVVVTGTIEWGDTTDATVTCDAAGVCRSEGSQARFSYEASDPRLDGDVTGRGVGLYHVPRSIYLEAGTRVLVNDDGRWVGTDTGLGVTDSITVDGIEYDTRFRGTYLNIDFIVMHGEDAYEGLTAIIVEDWEAPFGSPATFVGAIVPEVPAFPELPAE